MSYHADLNDTMILEEPLLAKNSMEQETNPLNNHDSFNRMITNQSNQSKTIRLSENLNQRSVKLFEYEDKNYKITYPKNIVITSRYTIISFLPKSLLEQFRRLANVYFLVIGLIAIVGTYTSYYQSSVSPIGILLPVLIVIMISMIKEGVEDIKRHRSDMKVNSKPVKSITNEGEVQIVQRQQLKVGSLVLFHRDDEIPADVVVLQCGGIQGLLAYVETAAIDGETNLKIRQPALGHIPTIVQLPETGITPSPPSTTSTVVPNRKVMSERNSIRTSNLSLNGDRNYVYGVDWLRDRLRLEAEPPNEFIYRFNGCLYLASPNSIVVDEKAQPEIIPLSDKNLLLRGSILRATEWCIGMVIYTGRDTKLSLNSKRPPSKLSSVDRIVNRTLLIAISVMIVVCIISMMFNIVWGSNNQEAKYLCLKDTDLDSFYLNGGGCENSNTSSGLTIFTFATLYNNFVCISMYVSLEMIYLCQSFFLSQDLDLYDEESDTRAECHSSGLCADLGQIQYILSDKTGTLTKNVMKVRRCALIGRIFGAPITIVSANNGNGGRGGGGGGGGGNISIETRESDKSASLSFGINKQNLNGNGNGNSEVKSEAIHEASNTNNSTTINATDTEEIGQDWEPLTSMRPCIISNTTTNNPSSNTQNHHLTDNLSDMLIKDFLRVLTLCNNVMLMPDDHGVLNINDLQSLEASLQAESPDEVALVLAAAQYSQVYLIARSNIAATILGLHSTSNHTSDETETWEIMAINEFESNRKRMSILLRSNDHDRYLLLCKGADSSMFSNCKNSSYTNAIIEQTEKFASTGLRTLIASKRDLTPTEASEWLTSYNEAKMSVFRRDEKLSSCALAIEVNMDILGCVGIEDELQDGVPTAIRILQETGLNVWMITGDKAETAIAIGKMCSLLTDDHNIYKFVGLSTEEIYPSLKSLESNIESLSKAMLLSHQGNNRHLHYHIKIDGSNGRDTSSLKVSMVKLNKESSTMTIETTPSPMTSVDLEANERPDFVGIGSTIGRESHLGSESNSGIKISSSDNSNSTINNDNNNDNGNIRNQVSMGSNVGIDVMKPIALVIDGTSLENIYKSPELKLKFSMIISYIPTVIACRVSPLQKASLVRMIKFSPLRPVTLAIGDGANDVGMINEAIVGVGISGKEGRHAANASDFAISQFRFLVPLLLEHGRFNYIRCSKLVLYSFYKNLLLVSILFYYCIYSGFSGTIPLVSLVFTGYNFYLGLPIIAIGAFDQDVPKQYVYRHPSLAYDTGRKGELLNSYNMLRWCLWGFFMGFIIFVLCIRMVGGPIYISSQYNDGNTSHLDITGVGLNLSANGWSGGVYVDGFAIFTIIIVTMQCKVISMTRTRTIIFWASILISMIGYIIFTYVYGAFDSTQWYDVLPTTFGMSEFWLGLVCIPSIITLFDSSVDMIISYGFPTSQDKLWRLYDEDMRKGSLNTSNMT